MVGEVASSPRITSTNDYDGWEGAATNTDSTGSVNVECVAGVPINYCPFNSRTSERTAQRFARTHANAR
jgi:hypothetical protein